MRSIKKSNQLTSLVIVGLVAACGAHSKNHDNGKQPVDQGSSGEAQDQKIDNSVATPKVHDPANSPPAPDLKRNRDVLKKVSFTLKFIVREFGADGADTAAMFIIQSNDVGMLGQMEVDKIIGPQFLDNHGVWGGMNQKIIEKFFNNGSNPMSQTRKQQLLKDYPGALVVYFEGYSGRLCNGQYSEVKLMSTLREVKVSTDFKFVATPTLTDDCNVTQSAMLSTTSESTGTLSGNSTLDDGSGT